MCGWSRRRWCGCVGFCGLGAGAGLVSGFPRQATETWMEWMLLPLIHFVLLGFLPLDRMRKGTDPAFAAGCGQFLMVTREAYVASGGHAEIRATMHDGLLLPRLLRQKGFRTDLADLTGLATCRMYRSAGEVWRGLAKNATEGIAAPARILPISALLFLGQVAPFLLLAWLLFSNSHGVKAEVWGVCGGRDCGGLAAKGSGGGAVSAGLARGGVASGGNSAAAGDPVVRAGAEADGWGGKLEGSGVQGGCRE